MQIHKIRFSNISFETLSNTISLFFGTSFIELQKVINSNRTFDLILDNNSNVTATIMHPNFSIYLTGDDAQPVGIYKVRFENISLMDLSETINSYFINEMLRFTRVKPALAPQYYELYLSDNNNIVEVISSANFSLYLI